MTLNNTPKAVAGCKTVQGFEVEVGTKVTVSGLEFGVWGLGFRVLRLRTLTGYLEPNSSGFVILVFLHKSIKTFFRAQNRFKAQELLAFAAVEEAGMAI